MEKKRKDLRVDEIPENGVKSSEGSSSFSNFKALFGSSTEGSSSNSLFSDNNPFRRKKQETRMQNPKQELPSGADDGNLDSLEIGRKNKSQKVDEKKENSDNGIEVLEKKKKLKGLRSEKTSIEKEDGHGIGISDTTKSNAESDNKKKKKRKREELEAEYEARHYGVASEVKENAEQASLVGSKRKNIDNPEDMMVSKEGFDDENKLHRTIFVGNLPLKMKKKELLKEFGRFGEIESVRIRSVPIVDGKMPRKGAVIKKRFNENGDSVHAYIVFKTEESAQESLTHNMTVIGGNHIRVDRACPPQKKMKGDNSNLYDKKRTIFVGNLPFDVKDEEIYKLFSGLKNLETSIEAVRVIRDPGSSLGKGIAYVLFKTMDAANVVVKKRKLKIRDRELRLSHAKSVETSQKSASAAFKTPERNDGNKMKPKSDSSYQGLRASKSGSQKKVHGMRNPLEKSGHHPVSESKKRMIKRPAVAARKVKARMAADASHGAGSKRKLADRTPESSKQHKKTRKLR